MGEATWLTGNEAGRFININEDDVAGNLVRDLFLARDGEMSLDDWQALWADGGRSHTSLGKRVLVTPALADKALRRLMERAEPLVIIEDEQRLVWPIQRAMAEAER